MPASGVRPATVAVGLAQMSALSHAVDACDKREWHDIIAGFGDAAIQQSWSWGALRWSEDKLSHLIVRDGRQVVAAAQVVTVSLPLIGAGIAHCKFGPMWRPRGEPERLDVYEYVLRALREEYALRRGLMLRIKPWEVANDHGEVARIRAAVGLEPRVEGPRYETFVVDMSRSLDELRSGLASKWRYNLRKTEERQIEIRRGSGADAARVFMDTYAEMRDVKSYVENSEVDILPSLAEDLPQALRPVVFTAYAEEAPAASIVVSHLGDVAYYLFGATGKLGRETGASYALFWEAMSWLKDRGCRWFDLVGARPSVPNGQHGYRQFKAGIVGKKNGLEAAMIDWQACLAFKSRVVVSGGDWARSRLVQLKDRVNETFNRA